MLSPVETEKRHAAAIVALGCSLGGLSALETLLPALPPDWPLKLVIVQHRSVESGDSLLRTLRRYCALPIREPQDKEPIRSGHVYIAPPDYHLLVEEGSFALSTEASVLHARPSIDVFFESVAEAYGVGVVGIILTGASEDGARGAARIKSSGGRIVIQEPAEAECAVMPQAALRAVSADAILTLAEIASYLLSLHAMPQEKNDASRSRRQYTSGR